MTGPSILNSIRGYDDKSRKVTIRDITPVIEDMDAFVEQLKACTHAKTLEFMQCKDGDQWIQPLLDALPELAVESLVLDCKLSADKMHDLGKALVKAPNIRTLDLVRTPLGDEGMKILAQYLPDTKVRVLRVNECEIGQDGITALAGVVAESTQMLAIETLENPGTNLIGEGFAATLEALIKNRSVSVWKFRNYPNGNPTRINAEVEEGYEELEKRFAEEGSPNLIEFLAPSLVGIANRQADKNKRVADTYLSQISSGNFSAEALPLPLRKAVFERGPIMVTRAKFPVGSNQIGGYIAFQKIMPVLAEGEAVTHETAFAAHAEHGLTPLDNPETWVNHPDLFSKLMAQAEDPIAQLHDTVTASGKDLQDYALTMIGAAEVIRQLNELGIMLHADLLLDAEGNPNELLRAALKQDAMAGIFQEENWMEGTQADLNALIRGLPDYAKDKIPNLHGLRAQIGRQQKQVRSVG